MRYNRYSALGKFSEEEYMEIVSSQSFILTEIDRLKALLKYKKITQNEFNNAMSLPTQTVKKIRDKHGLTHDDMTLYYFFSGY